VLAAHIRKRTEPGFTSRNANQILYRLLRANLVEKNGSTTTPTWSAETENLFSENRPDPTSERLAIPIGSLDGLDPVIIQIGTTEVKVMFEKISSINDPYMSPDWVGTHVLATINCNHPFWTLRLRDDSQRALFAFMVAQDAYVQWKSSQLHEPPDPAEQLIIRDAAMRLCTTLGG